MLSNNPIKLDCSGKKQQRRAVCASPFNSIPILLGTVASNLNILTANSELLFPRSGKQFDEQNNPAATLAKKINPANLAESKESYESRG